MPNTLCGRGWGSDTGGVGGYTGIGIRGQVDGKRGLDWYERVKMVRGLDMESLFEK
jgi:hypothetical protein